MAMSVEVSWVEMYHLLQPYLAVKITAAKPNAFSAVNG